MLIALPLVFNISLGTWQMLIAFHLVFITSLKMWQMLIVLPLVFNISLGTWQMLIVLPLVFNISLGTWQTYGKANFHFFRTCLTGVHSGLQIRVCIGKLFSLFLIQNICCGYSKKTSQ